MAGFLPPAHATGLSAGIAVGSDYVVNGLTRSQGDPVFQAQLGWASERGYMAGVWFSTMDLNPGDGPDRELDASIGKRWEVGTDWAFRAELTRYGFRPELPELDYDYTELRTTLAFRDFIELSAAYSPDYSIYSSRGIGENETALGYEAAAHFAATRYLTLSAGAGYRNLESLIGSSYWYWSAGAGIAYSRLSLSIDYIDTDDTAVALFGHHYAGDRVVATFALRLR